MFTSEELRLLRRLVEALEDLASCVDDKKEPVFRTIQRVDFGTRFKDVLRELRK
jgi:hypothetical protein